DARTLPSRELMRKAAHQHRIEADAIQLQPDVLDLLPRPANAVNDRRLADDVDHAHPRIERRIRILEDHLHLELLRARRLGGKADERSPAPVARAGRWSEQADRDA